VAEAAWALRLPEDAFIHERHAYDVSYP
jgi:hypothetical protein